MKGYMLMVGCVALVAGVAFGQTFDAKRGLRDPEKVVVNGVTNVIVDANTKALHKMTVQERAALWPYLDEKLVSNGTGRERVRAVFLQAMDREKSVGADYLAGRCRPVCAIRILASCGRVAPGEVAVYKEIVKKHAVQLARLKLFGEGKTPVAKDGKNPLTALIEPVIASLNGPACAGLIEALAAVGVTDLTEGGALPAFVKPDAGELAAMTAAARLAVVESGDPLAQGQLLLLLGVEGYNGFVRQFNEGK
jgi:hypothetical protein